jgi:phosphoribosylanthranilate isomerase
MAYHLRVKICGVTTADDARRAADLGTDAVGLNFFEGTPRCVDVAMAERILRVLPPLVEAVGVFVNTPLREAFALLQPLGVRTIQLHGDQKEMSDAFPYRLVPAFPLRDAASLAAVTRYLDVCRGLRRLPAAVLLDGHAAGQYGGTGRTAPWDLLASFRPGAPVILAGGLTAENVAEAVRVVRPYAVDAASGVESAPGRKDAEKMRRFIAAARAAADGI